MPALSDQISFSHVTQLTLQGLRLTELDADKDGSLSKTEASAMEALAAVFDKADADANGSRTGAEYKAYVAAQQAGAGAGGTAAGQGR